MKPYILIAGFSMIALPVIAGDQVDTVVNTLAALEANEGDLQAYCATIATPAAENNIVAQEEFDARIDAFYRDHPAYAAAADLDVDDPRIEEAFSRIEEKCATIRSASP